MTNASLKSDLALVREGLPYYGDNRNQHSHAALDRLAQALEAMEARETDTEAIAWAYQMLAKLGVGSQKISSAMMMDRLLLAAKRVPEAPNA